MVSTILILTTKIIKMGRQHGTPSTIRLWGIPQSEALAKKKKNTIADRHTVSYNKRYRFALILYPLMGTESLRAGRKFVSSVCEPRTGLGAPVQWKKKKKLRSLQRTITYNMNVQAHQIVYKNSTITSHVILQISKIAVSICRICTRQNFVHRCSPRFFFYVSNRCKMFRRRFYT
jgi:hypothetical protein